MPCQPGAPDANQLDMLGGNLDTGTNDDFMNKNITIANCDFSDCRSAVVMTSMLAQKSKWRKSRSPAPSEHGVAEESHRQ